MTTTNIIDALYALNNLRPVRKVEFDGGKVFVETRQGGSDETESEWLARLDAEAAQIDCIARSYGLRRVAGSNAGASAQVLVYG